MPRTKRYFPVARDINDDGEVWEFTAKFGDRSLRIWLECLSRIEETENYWRVDKQVLITLARKVRQSPATVWPAFRQLLANGWLAIRQQVADGSSVVVGAPKYVKFHRGAEQVGFLPSFLPSFLLSFPNGKETDGYVDNSKPMRGGMEPNRAHIPIADGSTPSAASTPDPWIPVWAKAEKWVKDGWGHAKGFVGEAKRARFTPEDVLGAFSSVAAKLKEIPDLDKWAYAWGTLKKIYPERMQAESEKFKRDPEPLRGILGRLREK